MARVRQILLPVVILLAVILLVFAVELAVVIAFVF